MLPAVAAWWWREVMRVGLTSTPNGAHVGSINDDEVMRCGHAEYGSHELHGLNAGAGTRLHRLRAIAAALTGALGWRRPMKFIVTKPARSSPKQRMTIL